MHSAVLGVVNRYGQSKSMISTLCACLALRSKEVSFFDISDTHSSHHDGYILRFTVFLWTTITTMTTTTMTMTTTEG